MVSYNSCLIFVNLNSRSISPTFDVTSNDLDGMVGSNNGVSKGIK